MIFQIFNKDLLKILTVFSMSPGSKFSRDDLKKRVLLNNVLLDNALNILINSKLILKQKRFLYLNITDDNVKNIISLVKNEYNSLNEIPLKVYFSIIDLCSYLSKQKNLKVYLFGSYAKLIFSNKSDVDIAIISDNLSLPYKKKISNMIQKIEKIYGKEIEIHYFSENFYKQKKDILIKDILKNGARLI